MTKDLYRIATEFQARLLSEGGPHRNQVQPVLRDGWATLYRWHQSGERVWRMTDDRVADLPAELELATAPTHGAACAYQLPERGEWIVVARHQAEEPVYINGPETGYAFPEPMLTYITQVDRGIAAGCINLEQQPTWGDLYLMAGQASGKAGVRWLEQDEIAEEERRFLAALRVFYSSAVII